MLVVTRKTDQRIQIGPDVTVTIVRIQGQRVKIGIEAPSGIRVCREEILHRAHDAEGPCSPRPALCSTTSRVSRNARDRRASSLRRRPSKEFSPTLTQ